MVTSFWLKKTMRFYYLILSIIIFSSDITEYNLKFNSLVIIVYHYFLFFLFFLLSKKLFEIFLNSIPSLSSISLSKIDCFKVFSYSKLIALIQSLDLVYRIFKFEKYSFVIYELMLDKTEKLPVQLIPTKANHDTVNSIPTPNPTLPIRIS